MRAVERKDARGSLKWIRAAINDCPDKFNEKIASASRIPANDPIEWVSPLSDDEYAEYRDQDFLDQLGLRINKHPLIEFWPEKGPQWDALARTGQGRIILLEAKANIPEVVSSATGAGRESRKLIEESLAATKAFLGVDLDILWTGKLYQYANRLAHLYFLRELNAIDAYLIFAYFTGDQDVGGPQTVAEWKAAITVAEKVLGLPTRNRLSKYTAEVFMDVSEIETSN